MKLIRLDKLELQLNCSEFPYPSHWSFIKSTKNIHPPNPIKNALVQHVWVPDFPEMHLKTRLLSAEKEAKQLETH